MKKFELKKKKKSCKNLRTLRKQAKTQSDDYKTWTATQVKAKIRAKDPQVKTTGLKKKEIVAMWVDKYSTMDDVEHNHDWYTKGDQRLLELLEEGKIERYDQTGIYVCAVKNRLDFLSNKVEHIPCDQALALATKIFQGRFKEKEDALSHLSTHFADNDYKSVVDGLETCCEIHPSPLDDESYQTDEDPENNDNDDVCSLQGDAESNVSNKDGGDMDEEGEDEDEEGEDEDEDEEGKDEDEESRNEDGKEGDATVNLGFHIFNSPLDHNLPFILFSILPLKCESTFIFQTTNWYAGKEAF